MNVIGANVLLEYGSKHPEALSTLQALHALISAADWTERADVERDCGTLIHFQEETLVVINVSEAKCCVKLSIHFGLGVVRILAATEL